MSGQASFAGKGEGALVWTVKNMLKPRRARKLEKDNGQETYSKDKCKAKNTKSD